MPSGFQIVQPTLLKIDGFKLNIDNVESLNKIFNIDSIEFNKKNSVFNSMQETILLFKN
jgi:hypothetical protein